MNPYIFKPAVTDYSPIVIADKSQIHIAARIILAHRYRKVDITTHVANCIWRAPLISRTQGLCAKELENTLTIRQVIV